jgi:hypothetical protein
MHLLELAEVAGVEVEVDYFHAKRRYSARLKGAEVIEPGHDGVLATVHGNGPSPEAAQRNYAKQIAGKRLVFGGLQGPRREFNVPRNLSY